MAPPGSFPPLNEEQTAKATPYEGGSPRLHSEPPHKDWIVIPVHSSRLKVLVLLSAIVFAFLIGRKAALELVAERVAQNQSVEDLRKAIRLSPGNAEYHHQLGFRLDASTDEANWKEALLQYEKAVQLNPQNAFYWLQLARAYESAQRVEDARRAIEQAARADPNQPLVAWQVGNFQLRYDNVEEALRQFRVVLNAAQEDEAIAQNVFDLVWRGTQNNRLILDLAIPPDSRIQFGYVNFLLAKGRLDESLEVWDRIAHEQGSFRPSSVFPLIDALLAARRVDEAHQTWKQLVHVLELNDLRLDGGNLLVNGGFEGDILNGGFDWRFTPLEHVGLQFDSVAFHSGTRSLAISFDGKENVAYNHFCQLVPVQPNTQYRFRGWMRAEQITTDSGPHFEIADHYAPLLPLAMGESVMGSSPWQETNLVFRTGAETKLLRVGVVRNASRKFDNKIRGEIWIDDVSLQFLPDVSQITTRTQSAK